MLVYLFCEKCSGVYELKAGESVEDFKDYKCACGGKLKAINTIRLVCKGCEYSNPITSKNCEACGRPLYQKDEPTFKNINFKKIDKEYEHNRSGGRVIGALFFLITLGFLEYIREAWSYMVQNPFLLMITAMFALIFCLFGLLSFFGGMNALEDISNKNKVKEN